MNDDVRKLIERLAPSAVCDECVADKLGLAEQQEASTAAHELVATRRFARGRASCVLCEVERMTTRRL